MVDCSLKADRAVVPGVLAGVLVVLCACTVVPTEGGRLEDVPERGSFAFAAPTSGTIGAAPAVATPPPTHVVYQMTPFSVTNWSTLKTELVHPAAYASVLKYNSSVLAVGGCLDAACSEYDNQSHQYDLLTAEHTAASRLPFRIAGPHSTVTYQKSVYVLRMCSYVHGDLSTINQSAYAEVLALSTGSTGGLQRLNVEGAVRPRANATCMLYAGSSTLGTILIIGGVNLTTGETLSSIDTITMNSATLGVYQQDVGNLTRPTMNIVGHVWTNGVFLAGGHNANGTVHLESYVVLFSSLQNNLPLCVTRLARDLEAASLPDLREPYADLQFVGWANWHIVKVKNTFASIYQSQDGQSWTYKDAGKPDFPFWDRRGGALVTIPVWAPGKDEPVQLALVEVGGVAQQTIQVPVTPPPPTTMPRDQTTAAPTTTAAATTAPTTTEAPEHNNHTATRTVVVPDPAGPLVAPLAVGGLLPAVESHWDAIPAATRSVVETVVLSAMTAASTTVTLPGPVLKNYTLNTTEGSSVVVDFQTSFEYHDGTSRCTTASPCTVALATSPYCRASSPNSYYYREPVTLDYTFVPGVELYMCFSFSTPLGLLDETCKESYLLDPPYSLLNFFSPFSVIDGADQPTSSPTTQAPAHKGGPSTTIIVLAVLASFLFVALIGAVLWVRLRQSAASAGLKTHSGRYEELDEIGQGAFGRVLRVRRTTDGAIFAQKHIDCPHANVLREALNEFELLRKLQAHPNIIRVVDMFLNYEVVSASVNSTPGYGQSLISDAPKRHLCIVMDYHPKRDLKLWALEYPGRIPEPVLCHIAVQTISVLSYIHQKHVIHRDLKPENLLIVSDREDTTNNTSGRNSGNHAGSGSGGGGGGGPGIMSRARSASGLGLSGRAASRPEDFPTVFQSIVVTDFGLAHLVAESRQVGFVGTAVYSAPECVALLFAQQQRSEYVPPSGGITSAGYGTTVNDQPESSVKGTGSKRVAPQRHHHQRTTSMGGPAAVTSQCDIWSLGCVLYAIATKRVERTTVRKMFEDVKRNDFAKVITQDLRDAGYSAAFAAFVLRLLQADPNERPTAKEALRYFRKSNRDQSYSISDHQKQTTQERRAQQLHPAGASRPSSDPRHRIMRTANTSSPLPPPAPALGGSGTEAHSGPIATTLNAVEEEQPQGGVHRPKEGDESQPLLEPEENAGAES